MQWKKIILGEYICTQKGYAFKSSWYTDSGVPIIKVSDFTDNSVNIDNVIFIPKDISNSYMKYRLNKDDIIVQTVGSWPSNPNSVVGKVIRIPDKASNALLNQNAVKLIPNKDIFNKYMYYLLKNDVFSNYIIGCAQGAASQASITLDAIKRFTALIPTDIKTQRKIAGILSAYDDLIENNNKRIKILEEMAQKLYKEWFVDFKFPGHENTKLVESELGLIPEGWEGKAISDTIKINPPTKAIPKNSAPFVPMQSLSESSMIISPIVSRVPSGGAKFINGDTLFARITPCLQNGKTGFVQFMSSNDMVATGSTEFIVLRETSQANRYFIYCLSRSNYFREHAINSMGGADGRQRVNIKLFDRLNINVPNKSLMNSFGEIVSPIFECIYTLEEKNHNLRKTRDMLLPRLISGELSVETTNELEAVAS